MTTVMVFGSFDHIHPGHLYLLRESKKHADVLVVVLARDETIAQVKGKPPKYSLKERKSHLQLTGIPDIILFGKLKDKFKVIRELKPDVICLGYDQNSFTAKLEEELKKSNLNPKIIRLKPYKEHIFKSSKLKKF